MSKESLATGSIEVPSGKNAPAGPDSLLTVSSSILVLTWIAFGILAALLSKLAWRPIMTALDAREESARRMAQEAERIARQKREWEESKEKRLMEVQRAAEEIVSKAKGAAMSAGAEIERAARQNAERMLDEARQEIARAADEARAKLRKEAAALAAEFAAAYLADKMDTRASEAIARDMAKDI